IDQSLAHARMLARVGILDDDEVARLEQALEQVRDEIGASRLEINADDEDIHMAIERRITEIAGAVGGKLHTARSRNDQVATDMAMFVRERAALAREDLQRLGETLIELAERHLDWPMPGYTHLQRAQPVYL